MKKKEIEQLSSKELFQEVKTTAEQEGFFLEEQVANIVKEAFKEIKHIETNAIFDEHRHDDLPRRGLDVLALGKTTSENSSSKLLACEVKSGGKDTKLILIRKTVHSENHRPLQIKGHQFGDRNEGLNEADTFVTLITENEEPLYCRTGDFYKWHENEGGRFKKSQTSLYKATEQLFYGVEGFLSNQFMEFWEDDLIGMTLIPVIVTNVDIYVAQNEGSTTATKVNYAIFENSIRFKHLEIDLDPHGNFTNKVFPYCWIVNVSSFSEFIKKPFSFNKSNSISWE